MAFVFERSPIAPEYLVFERSDPANGIILPDSEAERLQELQEAWDELQAVPAYVERIVACPELFEVEDRHENFRH